MTNTCPTMIATHRGAAIALSAALMAALVAVPAGAQQIISTGQSFLSAEFAVGSRHDDGRREAGLVMEIKPGWKTYWRAPGEAGVPPRLDWSGSENLAGVKIDWPRPEVFESFGYETLGYGGRVVLPLTLTPRDASRPIVLALEADLGVCRDICVFETVVLEREIMPDAPDADRASIGVARLSVPEAGDASGVSMASCRLAGAGAKRAFSARLSMPEGATSPHVVLEGPEGSWFEDVQTSPTGQGAYDVTATFRAPGAPAWIDRNTIVTTVLAGPKAFEVAGCTPTG